MKTMSKGYFESIIYKCFYMKIINVHEYHAYDKNNAEYVNLGTFPQ